mmetsp:Transcript_15689/g.43900  ORF Transcript_15689/g.43900 Transcript_15689/m.43900 type:complete len:260 (-) Transcript_15689:134-913(-)
MERVGRGEGAVGQLQQLRVLLRLGEVHRPRHAAAADCCAGGGGGGLYLNPLLEPVKSEALVGQHHQRWVVFWDPVLGDVLPDLLRYLCQFLVDVPLDARHTFEGPQGVGFDPNIIDGVKPLHHFASEPKDHSCAERRNDCHLPWVPPLQVSIDGRSDRSEARLSLVPGLLDLRLCLLPALLEACADEVDVGSELVQDRLQGNQPARDVAVGTLATVGHLLADGLDGEVGHSQDGEARERRAEEPPPIWLRPHHHLLVVR